jgi:DNA-binding response OmpR family regulator
LPLVAPVELVSWPRDEARRVLLARRGVPCLLLVAADAELPEAIGPTEDWVRLPADERDVGVRAQSLCLRLASAAADRPRVGDGVVVHAGWRAPLSASEATVLELLLESEGRIVSRGRLEEAAWPDGPPSPRSLDSLLYRLRRRAAAVNIHVLAARGRGFTVDVGPLACRARTGPS